MIFRMFLYLNLLLYSTPGGGNLNFTNYRRTQSSTTLQLKSGLSRLRMISVLATTASLQLLIRIRVVSRVVGIFIPTSDTIWF